MAYVDKMHHIKAYVKRGVYSIENLVTWQYSSDDPSKQYEI